MRSRLVQPRTSRRGLMRGAVSPPPSVYPLGEVLPQLGEVAGNHRGALPLHITAIPEVAVVVDGDHVTVEGDLDGFVASEPRTNPREEVVSLVFEVVGGNESLSNGVIHHGEVPFLLSPFDSVSITQICILVNTFF